MAGSLNKVQLIGNLGRDPEVRSFQNGGKGCNLRIATSENWKDRNTGERRERTEWHSVAIFNEGLVRVAEQYLRKGSKVYIEGQLQTRKWQDQQGQDRYTTEVVVQGFNGVMQMLGGKAQGQSGQQQEQPQQQQGGWGQPQQPAQQRQPQQQQRTQNQQPQYNEPPMDFDDDIPFN